MLIVVSNKHQHSKNWSFYSSHLHLLSAMKLMTTSNQWFSTKLEIKNIVQAEVENISS